MASFTTKDSLAKSGPASAPHMLLLFHYVEPAAGLLHKMPVFGFGCMFWSISSNDISFHHELMFAVGLEF